MLLTLEALAALLAGVAGAALLLYLFQTKLLFHPERLPPDFDFGVPGAVERFIDVPGARLSALHAVFPGSKGLVFYLHGNAGSLATWFTDTDEYRRVGFDLFMVDYRGYGKSTGRIRDEAQMHADVMAAWESVAPAYAGRPVVVIGRSLGSGLAARLAVRVRPALTVLVSPYWSMVELARAHYPWAPAVLVRFRLETWRDLPAVRGPVLFLHGARDALIPPGHSQRLMALCESAQMKVTSGAAHNDVQDFPEYRRELEARLAAL
jgi:uncharacterized protein